MLYPLLFQPIFKERVWGGRMLAELYQKPLPAGVPIGESWEISDRPEDVSRIANGPLAGKDLHWLVENHRAELLGSAALQAGRFPWLIKLLDAREKLSLQVHPPAAKAAALGGEPKTEMWYIADAAPEAELYVGLKRGVRREEFEQKVASGAVADCLHRIHVKRGDAIFLPSGRVHAIGAGLVIFEIQQNSDTTYRVFDWNRLGLDGRPRALHIRESLASIDFNDFEPALISPESRPDGAFDCRSLVNDPLFTVNAVSAKSQSTMLLSNPKLRVIGVVQGRAIVAGRTDAVELHPGQFCLIPATLQTELWCDPRTTFLLVQPGTCNPVPRGRS